MGNTLCPTHMMVLDQITACGGKVVNDSSADVVLLVNNFDKLPQLEAANQPLTGRSTSNYSMFDAAICSGKVIGFADNRYSNGADRLLIEYMAQQRSNSTCTLAMERFAYAGWNTDGTTCPHIRTRCLCSRSHPVRAGRFFTTRQATHWVLSSQTASCSTCLVNSTRTRTSIHFA